MKLELLNLVGALAWDPQVRGFLIFFLSVVVLPGSIYLLLATNVGARMGFLFAVAGISGWMFLLGITWAFYGQGLKGRDPSWKVQEVVHSAASSANNLEQGATKALGDFPDGWNKLPLLGSKILGDAQAAADNFITKSGRKPKIGHHGPVVRKPSAAELRYPAEFGTGTDYIVVGGYNKGGDDVLFTLGGHKFDFKHEPHYVVVQIQPVLDQEVPEGAPPPTPKPDTSAEVTNVVLLRDLGSVRFPQVMISIASLIIFLVTCLQLHRRDLQIMAARDAGTPA